MPSFCGLLLRLADSINVIGYLFWFSFGVGANEAIAFIVSALVPVPIRAVLLLIGLGNAVLGYLLSFVGAAC